MERSHGVIGSISHIKHRSDRIIDALGLVWCRAANGSHTRNDDQGQATGLGRLCIRRRRPTKEEANIRLPSFAKVYEKRRKERCEPLKGRAWDGNEAS